MSAPPPTAPPSPPGYELLERIGSGGMGVVYRAYDTALRRLVALKLLRDDLPANSSASRRFLAEARVTGRLQHPGIPPIHQVGTLPDGRPFLAMKLIEGQTLSGILREDTTDQNQLIVAFERLCEAVGFAHSMSVVHRDLKPANIMVGAFGEVQVMDWGLAKETRNAERGTRSENQEAAESSSQHSALRAQHSALSTQHSDRTQPGSVLGTPAYMAPEQARGEKIDSRADVFALGGILCAILTRQPPFLGDDPSAVLALAAFGGVSGAFRRLDKSGADPELIALCKWCLAPEADDRPADGKAVADAVARLRAAHEERARQAELDREKAQVKASERRKRRRVLLVLGLAIGVLAAGLGVSALSRQFEDQKRAAIEQARLANNGKDVAGLLARCETALRADDAGTAGFALAEAENRATSGGAEHLAGQFERCRADLAMLRELDGVDVFRWTSVEGYMPGVDDQSKRWAEAFTRFGIVPGTTPPPDAAGIISRSFIAPRVLTNLDEWLKVSRSAAIADILHTADPDPFRDAVRAALVARNDVELRQMVSHPEAHRQPARFAVVLRTLGIFDRDQTRSMLVEALTRDPKNFGVLVALGLNCALDTPVSCAEAEGWYRAALVARPENPLAWNNLGHTLARAGNHAAAVEAYQHAIRIDPLHADAHTNLSGSLRLLGDTTGSLAAAREAIRLNPTNFAYHYNLGNVLQDTRNYPEAIAAFRESLRLNPKFRAAQYNLGTAYQESGDLKQAIAEYRAAIQIDPQYALARRSLANALRLTGDLIGALLEAREGVRLDPNSAQARETLGNVRRDRREYAAAATAYREATRLNPKLASAHSYLGDVLFELGDFDGAIVAFRETVRLQPNFAGHHQNLGWTYLITKNYPAAVAAYREAVRLDPRNATFRNNLGMALAHSGDIDAGLAEIREATRLDPRFAPALARYTKLKEERERLAPLPREVKPK